MKRVAVYLDLALIFRLLRFSLEKTVTVTYGYKLLTKQGVSQKAAKKVKCASAELKNHSFTCAYASYATWLALSKAISSTRFLKFNGMGELS